MLFRSLRASARVLFAPGGFYAHRHRFSERAATAGGTHHPGAAFGAGRCRVGHPTGEVIYELPGYLPSKELSALLKYMQSQKWKGKDKDTISLEINESLRNAFIDL